MRKLVSKRIFGALTYLVGLGMAVAGGLDNYNVDTMLVLAVLANGTALLGIDAWKQVQTNTLGSNGGR